MLSPNNSEIKGSLQEYPFAELLTETSQVRLNGSFRLSNEEKKVIVYLKNGEIVFAVSNLRQHRLFEMLLQSNRISKESLAKIPNFTNDLELAENLVNQMIFPKPFIEDLIGKQIKEIIKTILQWQNGVWTFSHLARAKENIQFQVDTTELLLEYARNLPKEIIVKRFKSMEERFATKEIFSVNLNLLPQEAFIFSRMTPSLTKLQEITQLSGIPDAEVFKTLYVLWLGNLIVRKNWNSAFSESWLRQVLSVKVTLIKEAVAPVTPQKAEPEVVAETQDDVELELEDTEAIDERKLLEEYLDQVENAHSYYEILDVPIKAPVSEIKTAYFKWAKLYHPDKFHQETNLSLQQKVQNAFTEIARAYETLKDEKSREVYDYKLRKYLETVKEETILTEIPKPVADFDKAREEFDQGFDLVLIEEYEAASPFLARAVQMSPDNARYHAYYGKALSFVGNQRHKAESEIQAAIKLDSSNPTFRIMLVEFYIQFNLLKRAEGELQRLLAQFPDNREAQVLLDSLSNK